MKLKKCVECKKYTLKEICSKCNEKTKEAHYKFIKLRDVKENSEFTSSKLGQSKED